MEDDTVVRLPRPGASVEDDPLLEVLRGARRMLQQVIATEVVSIRLTASTASGAATAILLRVFMPISASTKNLRLAACRFEHRARLPLRLIKPVEAAVRFSLQDAGEVAEMALGMLAAPIRGVEEHGSRRVGPAEWPVVPDVGPHAALGGLPLGQDRDRRVVAIRQRPPSTWHGRERDRGKGARRS